MKKAQCPICHRLILVVDPVYGNDKVRIAPPWFSSHRGLDRKKCSGSHKPAKDVQQVGTDASGEAKPKK